MAAPSRRRAARAVHTLREAAAIAHLAEPQAQTLDAFLLTAMGSMLVSRACVLVREPDAGFTIAASKGLAKCATPIRVAIARAPRRAVGVGKAKDGWRADVAAIGIETLYPVVVRGRVEAFLGIGPFATRTSRSEREAAAAFFVQVLAQLVEREIAARRLAAAERSLARKARELDTLVELSLAFGTVHDERAILRTLGFALMGQMTVSEFGLYSATGVPLAVRMSRPPAADDVAELARLRAPLLASAPPRAHAALAARLAAAGVSAASPIELRDDAAGVILAGRRLGNKPLTAGDAEYLRTLGSLALTAVENARLFRAEIEKQRMEVDLARAREIQQRLLPRKIPTIAGLDVAARMEPTREVGGDYYDVMPLSRGRVLVVIADVSGKGIPASLLMANVQAAIRALAPVSDTLTIMIERANDLLFENTEPDRFVTLFAAIVGGADGSVRYLNAGHNPPLVFRDDGSIESLTVGGPILGAFPGITAFEEGTTSLGPRDRLVLYTDGLSEAMNARGEEWGEPALTKCAGASPLTAAEIIDGCFAGAREHAAGAAQSDDMTMVAVVRDPPPA
jgi:sigma-B regulation protein RsbU (phosphoserine phosphatase)